MARPTRGIGDKWIDVCRLLNRRDAAYIVVGGIAVNLHGHVRATRDPADGRNQPGEAWKSGRIGTSRTNRELRKSSIAT